MKFKKIIPHGILFLFLVFYTGIITYANRAHYFAPYDALYWQNRFEESQWRLRFTERTIGDDGLYTYQGYTYTHGADPTSLNAEHPPLGRYIIGWSTRIFGNPYWAGMITILCSIIIFFFLLNTMLSSPFLSLFGSILFALDPLVLQQATVTMLDSSQLLFFMLFLLFFLFSLRTKKKNSHFFFIALAGLSLGGFSAVKFPFLTPLFLVTAIAFLWIKKTTSFLLSCFLLVGGTATVYVASYARYFQIGHSFVDWLGVQKWIITFYTESTLVSNYGSIVTTLLFNKIQNLVTGSWESGDVWSFSWPCMTILFFVSLVLLAKKRKQTPLFFFIIPVFSLIIGVFYAIVPFWTRYLLILLPLFYTSVFYLVKHFRHPVICIAFLTAIYAANIYSSCMILFPTPEKDVQQFVHDWEHGYFNDMYQRLDASSKTITRDSFHRLGQTYWTEGNIEQASISVDGKSLNRWGSTQYVPLTVTYNTIFLGSFTETVMLHVVRENGTWKFMWDFSNLIEGLKPESHIKTTVDFSKRGSIFENQELRAEDFSSQLLSIVPNQIDTEKETEMLTYVQNLFKGTIMAAAIHDRYVVARLPDVPVAIGIFPYALLPEEKETLLSYPGIMLTPANGRWQMHTENLGNVKNTLYNECCSYLYSTDSYDGISGLEQQYNETLKGTNGGTIRIIDQEGNIIRTIVDKKKTNGKEAVISTKPR